LREVRAEVRQYEIVLADGNRINLRDSSHRSDDFGDLGFAQSMGKIAVILEIRAPPNGQSLDRYHHPPARTAVQVLRMSS
jgi:hypothetical protein